MSNIIPPLLSNSPPPVLGALDDEDDDEFGDFTDAATVSYGCDVLSSQDTSTVKTIDQSIPNHHHENDVTNISKTVEKDFQDKRKDLLEGETYNDKAIISSESNNSNCSESSSNLCDNKLKTNVDNKYNTFQYFPEIPPDIVPESNDEDDDDEFGDVENDFLDDDFGEFQDNVKNESKTENVSSVINNISVEHSASDLQTCPDGKLNDTGKSKTVEEDVDAYCANDTGQANTEVDNKINSVTENSTFLNDETKIEHPHKESVEMNDEPVITIVAEFNSIDSLKREDQQAAKEEIASNNNDDDDYNDFGDFETHQEDFNKTNNIIEENIQEDKNSLDKSRIDDEFNENFGDFIASSSDPILWPSDPYSSAKDSDDTDNNFGNFDNQVFEIADVQSVNNDKTTEIGSENKNGDDDDDFGDFNDYSLQTQTSSESNPEDRLTQVQKLCSDMNSAVAAEQAQTIILEMFPVTEQSTSEHCAEDFTSSDKVFSQLKDVTDTCALLYQWSKSQGQGCLLKALNIDTRNILYGPRWNESMPRYAATLGFTPLEPVKSDTTPQQTALEPPVITATTTTTTITTTAAAVVATSSQIPSTETVQQNDIPSAQFDWVSSGLTNPLENSPGSTMLLDLEQLVASLDIQFSSTLTPKSLNSASPVNDMDDWEFWLKLTPKKEPEEPPTTKREEIKTDEKISSSKPNHPEITPTKSEFDLTFVLQPEVNLVLQSHSDSGSVKSLQLNDVHVEETTSKIDNVEDEFDDFTSFQSTSSRNDEPPNYSVWSFNPVVLRETHISNNNQTDVKPEKLHNVIPSNIEEPGWLKPTILTPDLPRKINVDVTKEVQMEEEEFSEFQTSSIVNDKSVESKTSLPKATDNDEEFTDFQSTLPNPVVKPASVIQKPLQPTPAAIILEPLKPVVMQSAIPTSINWPDPGISDYDLIRIELNYKPHSSSLSNSSEASNEVNVKEEYKHVVSLGNVKAKDEANNNDDDDWSDFVSNQEPISNAQPVLNKMVNNVQQPSRISTPELPLCIPQLNHIALPKRPVPVITQQGLVQTKLAAEHLVLPSVQQKKTYPRTSQHPQNSFQPSLISSQFAAQFGQGLTSHNTQLSRPQENNVKHLLSNLQDFSGSSKVSTLSVSSDKADDFDDEWTDFVSSQPIPPSAVSPSNGFHRNPPRLDLDWNRPPQFTSWSATVTPNIITNPVSFDSFQSYTPPPQTTGDFLKSRTNNKKNPNIVIQPKKSTIPSISTVPDLEFIGSKNRTWKK